VLDLAALVVSLGEARLIIEESRIDYNTVRPHGRLGKLRPAVYGATRSGLGMQRDGALRSCGGYAPPPRCTIERTLKPETDSTHQRRRPRRRRRRRC
jgi:hypothetical protein